MAYCNQNSSKINRSVKNKECEDRECDVYPDISADTLCKWNLKIFQFPLYSTDKILFNTCLLKFPKSKCDQSVIIKSFANIKKSLPGYTFLYTDGSKTHSSVSFSITTTNNLLKIGLLPNYFSIFSAEIIAILEAAYIASNFNTPTAICTDSLCSINCIKNPKSKNIYAETIKKVLKKQKHPTIIIWVPSHCGIKGNELADKAAKRAHHSGL